MLTHALCSGVWDIPWTGFRRQLANCASDRCFPHVLRQPARKQVPATIAPSPQSHWHSHMALPPALLGSLEMTVSIPNRWPVKSFSRPCAPIFHCLHNRPLLYKRGRLWQSISGDAFGMALTNYIAPGTASRMGRPPLNVKETKVRLTDDQRRRIEAAVGPNRMATFIREAVDEKLDRHERRGSSPSDGSSI